jgi:hypothetical protein
MKSKNLEHTAAESSTSDYEKRIEQKCEASRKAREAIIARAACRPKPEPRALEPGCIQRELSELKKQHLPPHAIRTPELTKMQKQYAKLKREKQALVVERIKLDDLTHRAKAQLNARKKLETLKIRQMLQSDYSVEYKMLIAAHSATMESLNQNKANMQKTRKLIYEVRQIIKALKEAERV